LDFTYGYAAVAREITTGVDLTTPQIVRDNFGEVGRVPLQPSPSPIYFTLLSSMFMHGDLMHLFGNMLYLWIFGDNLEDRLGHIRYAVFYLVCGIIAALAQILSDPNSVIPLVGASGAISGILGGYILLFPRRNVRAIVFFNLIQVPAFVALGIWIGFQVLQGYFARAGEGGVAYTAHIGGFVAGLLLIKIFALGTSQRQRLAVDERG
jgi:membrane associated rhomboid family serine protease